MKLAAALFTSCFVGLAAHSAEEPVDPVLLEFLGSVDSEDKNWHDYLAHTDIDKVAAHAGAARENVQPPAAPPPKPPADPLPSSPAPVSPAPVQQK